MHNRRCSEAQPTDKPDKTKQSPAWGEIMGVTVNNLAPCGALKNLVWCCRSVGSASLHQQLCTSHPCGVK
ncbi:MAG: hypothetical protein LBP87_05940, partial [Planctomycetaceae bacterium]|nr:hypothetical protein [Planctomycetaceae bacterium]